MRGALRAARVRVPCSSSNLGAGFDCVGLALDRWLDVTFEPGDATLEVVRDEEAERPVGTDLLAQSFEVGLARRGREAAGVLRVRSEIPLARGLGSSAAALVAGTALAGLANGEELNADEAYGHAAVEEGHGDNASASAYGGLTAVVGGPRGLPPMRCELHPGLAFPFAAPPTALPTREAREALPPTVPHAAAADAVARMAALLRGLATAEPDLLRMGFDDLALHAPWRRAMIPGADDAFAAALDAGAWGVTVSGAGSGLLAVSASDAAADVARAMGHALAHHYGESGILAWPLRPVHRGVRAEAPRSPTWVRRG